MLDAESLCQQYGTVQVAEVDRMRVLESLRVGILFLSHLCVDGFTGDLSGGKGKSSRSSLKYGCYRVFKFVMCCVCVGCVLCNKL